MFLHKNHFLLIFRILLLFFPPHPSKWTNLLQIHYGAVLYEVPVGIIVLLSIFYGSISIIAVIGNSLVIWIVATTRQMQTVTNLFIANLALADVVIGMFVIPFQVFYSISSFNFIYSILFIYSIVVLCQGISNIYSYCITDRLDFYCFKYI